MGDTVEQVLIKAMSANSSPVETLPHLECYEMFTFKLLDISVITIFLSELFNICGFQNFNTFQDV